VQRSGCECAGTKLGGAEQRPDTARHHRRITVSGYDLNSTDFQLVRVQYRRSDGDGAWINIPSPGGVFERYNPELVGLFHAHACPKGQPCCWARFYQFFWETAGYRRRAYEIHAWAVCTGDASDKPGFRTSSKAA
jgi:hypothetical protein